MESVIVCRKMSGDYEIIEETVGIMPQPQSRRRRSGHNDQVVGAGKSTNRLATSLPHESGRMSPRGRTYLSTDATALSLEMSISKCAEVFRVLH